MHCAVRSSTTGFSNFSYGKKGGDEYEQQSVLFSVIIYNMISRWSNRGGITGSFEVSPDLDLSGFIVLEAEISFNHPLHPIFSQALARIGLLEPSRKLTHEELQLKIASFYSAISKEMNNGCVELQQKWNSKAETFLRYADDLFDNSYHGPTHFVAYPSIWRVYIQQPAQHAISFPLQRDVHDSDDAFYVVLHELLHIFFFEFLGSTDLLRGRSDIWDISEVFNILVLRQPQFAELYTNHTVTAYPQHQKVVSILENLLSGANSAKNIIESIYHHIDRHSW